MHTNAIERTTKPTQTQRKSPRRQQKECKKIDVEHLYLVLHSRAYLDVLRANPINWLQNFMHILLTSDNRLDPQKNEPIQAFRKGELERSAMLFESILEHWPLDPTASTYLDSIKELLDWGVEPTYLTEHWQRIESFMFEDGPLIQPLKPSSPPPFELISSSPDTPGRRTSTPLEEMSVELPEELRMVFQLYQDGRRKAAFMWAQSYLESQPDSKRVQGYLDLLPGDIQSQLQAARASKEAKRLVQKGQHSPHDSTPPRHKTHPPANETQTGRSWLPWALLVVGFSAALAVGIHFFG
jgi:hypothetical protein